MRAFATLYDLMLRTQFNRARAATLAALGLLGVVIGAAVGAADDATLADGVRFVDGFGLTLVLPVTCLVFASAALGDLVEDQTLVYLTMRPVARGKIALAAALASLSIVVPLVVVPLVAAGAAARIGGQAIAASVVAAAVGAVEYTAVFVLAGLFFKRALTVGLVYIFIWEQFVARASHGVRRFTISAYTRSILAKLSDIELSNADMALGVSIAVPLVVAAAALALAGARLRRQDVA